jgi:hypothetical protein
MLNFLKIFKSGGGNCSSSNGTKGTKGKCPPSLVGETSSHKSPPKTIQYNDEDMSNIIFKIVKAKKEGLTAEQVLNYDEKKAYDNYLLQKKEKDLKFKAKQEEAARIKEAEIRRKESAKLEETRRKEAISKKKLEIEERRKRQEEEKKQKQEEDARQKLEAETRMKEEAANARISIYKKANPSRADLLVQNFGKSSSKISKRSKRSKGSKGGKKQTTRRNN